MAYPARNFEKDPSKRTKGWYMVPGKGRRYWDGKAFKFRSPDGTTNLKGLAGSVISRVKDAVKTKPNSGRSGRSRSRNRGQGSAVQSTGGRSTAPNPESKSAQNNPSSQTKPEVKKAPVTKPEVKKPPVAKKPAKAKQTGDRSKDMAAWAKANQKLAQRFLDKNKNKAKKPSGYAAVAKALKEARANKTGIPKTYNA